MDELMLWEYVDACAAHYPLHCSPCADSRQDVLVVSRCYSTSVRV